MGSMREVARANGISVDSVRNIVNSDATTTRIVQEKRRENTLDMLAYMDTKVDIVQKFIDMCLGELTKPERLEKARLSEITTAMGTAIDKWTGVKWRNDGSLQKLDQIIDGLTQEADRVNKDDKQDGSEGNI